MPATESEKQAKHSLGLRKNSPLQSGMGIEQSLVSRHPSAEVEQGKAAHLSLSSELFLLRTTGVLVVWSLLSHFTSTLQLLHFATLSYATPRTPHPSNSLHRERTQINQIKSNQTQNLSAGFVSVKIVGKGGAGVLNASDCITADMLACVYLSLSIQSQHSAVSAAGHSLQARKIGCTG